MKINNQTAVQWLAKQLEDYGDPQVCELTWKELDTLVEQAKEMEKQQIKESWKNANLPVFLGKKLTAEQYYNETFK